VLRTSRGILNADRFNIGKRTPASIRIRELNREDAMAILTWRYPAPFDLASTRIPTFPISAVVFNQ